ncbi:hypothetical protein [Magnetospirillum sp. 64-120]|uniref:hypothetical protein n=1 Tax=Magnetospirillum sp. 64-120 TaxID=1895778 RepID=UPI0009284A1C|nr:hypothetical protein [Magnetospirillum sp. 64-120]OJX71914.1 MAG: hypothetical protein BGO92_04530 [Magnetospirillum sp. 64-120]
MDEVEQLISLKFQDSPRASAALIELWQGFKASGLADRIFVPEITNGDEGKFWSRVWEMILYRELIRAGHLPVSADRGPDFGITLSGRRMWFEAVCPAPTNLDEDWLRPVEPGEFRVRSFPHQEITLRLTAAISAKSAKLDRYLGSGIVGEGDGYVICVNSGQLSEFPEYYGVSGAPLIAEAVFPIGPVAIPFNRNGDRLGEPYVSTRPSIINHNGQPVPTTSFLDRAFAGVSAVMAFASRFPSEDMRPVIVHNPFARVPLPVGFFPGGLDYVAEMDGHSMTLRPATA